MSSDPWWAYNTALKRVEQLERHVESLEDELDREIVQRVRQEIKAEGTVDLATAKKRVQKGRGKA